MTTQQLYQNTLNEQISRSQFLWNVRRDPTYSNLITSTMTYEDTVKVLKSKGHIWDKESSSSVKTFDFLGTMRKLNESASTPKQKLKGGKGDKLTPDRVNYYEFQKGWKHELEHTEDIDKAKEIALDHLAEDPLYYTRLEMIEFKAKKKNRADLPVEVKKDNFKDEANQMEKVKKITSSRSGSVKSEKLEEPKKNVGNRKEKAKKVKVKKMKGGSGEMKTLKEGFSGPGNYKIKYKKEGDTKEKGSDVPIKSSEDYEKIKKSLETAKNIVVSFEKIADSPSIKTSTAPKGPVYKSKIKIGDKWVEVNLTDEEIEKRRKKGVEVQKISNTPIGSTGDKTKTSTTSKSDDKKEPEPETRNVPGARVSGERRGGGTIKVPYNKGVAIASTKPSTEYPYYIVDVDNESVVKGVSSIEAGRVAIKELPKQQSSYKVMSGVATKAKGYLKESKLSDAIKSKTQKRNLKGKTVSFVLPGDNSDPDSLKNIEDVIQSVSVNTEKNVLEIKLEGKGRLIFKIHEDGFITPIYNKGQEVKKVKNIGETLQKILDELYPIQNNEDTVLEAYIRERIKQAIKESGEYNYVGLEGPEVKKKHLEDYLKRYEWGWQKEDENLSKKEMGNEIHGVVAKYVTELGDDGIDLFNSYAPEEYQISSLDDLEKYGADQVSGLSLGAQYNPEKWIGRGDRVAENRTEEDIVRDAKRYNNPNSPEFKQALKDLQNLVADYGKKNKKLPKNVTDAIKQMSDLSN